MIPIVEAEIAQAKIDKEQAEQSAINKLKALGLTDAEVEAFRK
jgi:ABC-type polar amino acid transport system ATPase subunit